MVSSFNRRITVKSANVAIGATGGPSSNGFTTRFTTWAHIENMSTNRKVYYGMDAFESAYLVQVRWASSREFTSNDLIDYLDGGVTKTLIVKSVTLNTEGYKKFNTLIAVEFTTNA